ncbi:MAG: hypothetical protein KF773_06755 [Deltaproteobacteria bacterium]|nr:hypothetical protein [Deltaproteobacteria bacterium]
MKLGVPLEKQAGYTCGPPRGTDGFSTQNHSCVKFVDARCSERPTKIHHIRSSGDVPRGLTCFMDEFTGATYLDRKLLLPPLFAVRLVGTDTNDPKVFQIHFTFAADDLTETSRLGKALIAKYGPPTSRAEPVRMVWQAGDVELRAECRTIGGDNAAIGDYCTLSVEDRALDHRERERAAGDAAAAREAAGPPPPSL